MGPSLCSLSSANPMPQFCLRTQQMCVLLHHNKAVLILCLVLFVLLAFLGFKLFPVTVRATKCLLKKLKVEILVYSQVSQDRGFTKAIKYEDTTEQLAIARFSCPSVCVSESPDSHLSEHYMV